MKGIVFTEFISMIDGQYSPEVVEKVLEHSNLTDGGAYTSVGTYEHTELVQLISNACEITNVSTSRMLKDLGRHLLGVFRVKFPELFLPHPGPLEFLESVDAYVHVEVLKLYPDAELPKFSSSRISNKRLLLDYHSSRHLEDLALGLIEETVQSFGCKASIQVSSINLGGADCTRFDILIS